MLCMEFFSMLVAANDPEFGKKSTKNKAYNAITIKKRWLLRNLQMLTFCHLITMQLP